MTMQSKRRKALVEKVDRAKDYDAAEALALVKAGHVQTVTVPDRFQVR